MLNTAGDPAPDAEAVTSKGPPPPAAVISGDVAIPSASVGTVLAPVNMTVAPLPGAANVTCSPLIGLPNESAARTLSRPAYCVPEVADCPSPSTAESSTALFELEIVKGALTPEAAPLTANRLYVPAVVTLRSANVARP